MNIALFLKNNLKSFPPSMGVLLNRLSYEFRPGIGNIYRKRKKEIHQIEHFTNDQKQAFVFERMNHLVRHAYDNISFYKEYYDKQGFHPNQLQDFRDLNKIPIIRKSDLNNYSIEDRSFAIKDRYRVNTGGSSGTPFSLYIEPSSMGHEWAHMHRIWARLGYSPHDLKIVFGGRSDVKKIVEYDVVRNHFAIDIYADYKVVAKKLKNLLKKYKIKYLHGYPSSIYDFALYCEKEDVELQTLLRNSLVGAFLGSEYPHKKYRKKTEEVFGIKTISWYGHTERALLAYEKNDPLTYFPFLSYGFSEVKKNNDNNLELISTSYYNYASPLIRYNTEDTVQDCKIQDGILVSFKILKGREGEFVFDKTGKKVSLTALIFGRHHKLFNYSDFIQVRQKNLGEIEVLYVAKEKIEKPHALFDINNLDLEIRFKQLKEPIKTMSGKVNLLVK